MQPVPARPHLPVQQVTANLTAFIAYVAYDSADQQARELLHPNDKSMIHRPTIDTVIKNNVMLALGTDLHVRTVIAGPNTPTNMGRSPPRHRVIITNTTTAGTSRNPMFRNREQNRWDQAPTEIRASRTIYDAYQDASISQLKHNNDKRPHDTYHHQGPHDIRAVIPTPKTPSPTTKIPTPIPTAAPTTVPPNARTLNKCYICQDILPRAVTQ